MSKYPAYNPPANWYVLPITHQIKDGYCVICGDTEEWLTERGYNVEPFREGN